MTSLLLRASLVLALLAFVLPVARAETLLLIHGHLGGAHNWRGTGIAARLVDAGWHDAGTIGRWRGKVTIRGAPGRAAQRFYTVQLDGRTRLQAQTTALAGYVTRVLIRHPGSPLILVGHSAGGLVARLFMVQNPRIAVAALITIATPHLGTPLAQFGELIEESPLAWLVPYMGANGLGDSFALYRDLAEERPGNFLYLLNRRPHPPARYISVVRTADDGISGDLLVPDWSQDLRRVAALRGRAHTLREPGTHALSERDATLLIHLLRWLQQA